MAGQRVKRSHAAVEGAQIGPFPGRAQLQAPGSGG